MFYPTGDDVPPSAFSLTTVGEWDRFRNIDMDKEVRVYLCLLLLGLCVFIRIQVT